MSCRCCERYMTANDDCNIIFGCFCCCLWWWCCCGRWWWRWSFSFYWWVWLQADHLSWYVEHIWVYTKNHVHMNKRSCSNNSLIKFYRITNKYLCIYNLRVCITVPCSGNLKVSRSFSPLVCLSIKFVRNTTHSNRSLENRLFLSSSGCHCLLLLLCGWG